MFRGLTILGMILVNNPGDWGDLYWPLEHAEWFGWTPTDLVFPFFLFIVGTVAGLLAAEVRARRRRSMPAVYWRIVRRTIVLILLGLGLGVSYRLFNYLFGDATSIELQRICAIPACWCGSRSSTSWRR